MTDDENSESADGADSAAGTGSDVDESTMARAVWFVVDQTVDPARVAEELGVSESKLVSAAAAERRRHIRVCGHNHIALRSFVLTGSVELENRFLALELGAWTSWFRRTMCADAETESMDQRLRELHQRLFAVFDALALLQCERSTWPEMPPFFLGSANPLGLRRALELNSLEGERGDHLFLQILEKAESKPHVMEMMHTVSALNLDALEAGVLMLLDAFHRFLGARELQDSERDNMVKAFVINWQLRTFRRCLAEILPNGTVGERAICWVLLSGLVRRRDGRWLTNEQGMESHIEKAMSFLRLPFFFPHVSPEMAEAILRCLDVLVPAAIAAADFGWRSMFMPTDQELPDAEDDAVRQIHVASRRFANEFEGSLGDRGTVSVSGVAMDLAFFSGNRIIDWYDTASRVGSNPDENLDLVEMGRGQARDDDRAQNLRLSLLRRFAFQEHGRRSAYAAFKGELPHQDSEFGKVVSELWSLAQRFDESVRDLEDSLVSSRLRRREAYFPASSGVMRSAQSPEPSSLDLDRTLEE